MNSGTSSKLLTWLRQTFYGAPAATSSQVAPSTAQHDAQIALLTRLQFAREALAAESGGNPTARRVFRALTRVEARLRRPVRVAVLGEFNTGKSSLVHLLLGGVSPQSSVMTDVRVPIHFRHGEKPALAQIGADGRPIPAEPRTIANDRGARVQLLEARLPVELLRGAEIIDAPGSANPIHDASALFPRIARNVQIALWCTSATQAWKGSEQRMWLTLPPRLRRASLLVVTHADRLRKSADREKVMDRLRRETAGYFRKTLMVSSTAQPWHTNGGAELAHELSAAIASVTAAREQAATRTARRIAGWAFERLSASGEADDAAALMAAWIAYSDTLGANLSTGAATNAPPLGAFARAIFSFVSDTLGPWLDRHSDAARRRMILDLFRCDLAMLADATDGVRGEAVTARLRGILRQLREELAEMLRELPAPRARPSGLTPETRAALEPLLELAEGA